MKNITTRAFGRATTIDNSGRAAATGYSGIATATGDYGHATATGYCGHASATGKFGVAIAGHNGAAKADKSGCVAVIYWDFGSERPRIAVGYVGENGIKADTWYCVENGTLKEVE